MNTKQIKEICLRELLAGEQFLISYQKQLESLHSSQGFMFEIKQISQTVPLEIEFSLDRNNKDFIFFKKEKLNEALFKANVYRDYEDFHDIVEDVKSKGKTKLSATISIYYAMRFMDYKEKA